MRLICKITLYIALATLTACGQSAEKGHGEEGHDHEHAGELSHEAKDDRHKSADSHKEHAEEGHGDEIVFTKEQAKAAGLTLETVRAGEFREGIKTSGQVLSAQGDDETLVARSPGIVRIAAQSLVEGAEVTAGKTLFTISAQAMADGDATDKLRLEYEAALKEYERAADLAKDRIVTQRELEQLKLKVDVAKENLKYGTATTAAATTVNAPFKGYVKQLLVRHGEYVQAGTPLAVITQNKRLQLRADVSERYYSHLNHITGANFRLTGSQQTLNIESLGGRLVSYGRSTATDVCFVPVIFEFDNRGAGIVAGSFCDVFMLGQRRQNVISVPIAALTEEQGMYYVYVKVDDEGYRKQEVEIGETDGLRREIRSGLSDGDQIVVKGAVQVKLAGMSGVIPAHTHEH